MNCMLVAVVELRAYNRLIDYTWVTSLHLDIMDGYQESRRDLRDSVSALFRITLRAFVVFISLPTLSALMKLSRVYLV